MEKELIIFYLTENLPVMFKIDILGLIFAAVTIFVWILCGIHGVEYFKGDKHIKRYFVFYFLSLGALLGLEFAGNMLTFYFFYELMSLLSMPLVFHTETKEAIMAGLKYLLYSLCGAYFVLFGFYFVYLHGNTIAFTKGGVFTMEVTQAHSGILLAAAFCMILGFSVKAGMFPMQAWLWAAHPVAPAPASAFLSGIIVKAGVLGIIRTVFYIFGADFIRGTWVQTVILSLSLITVFMGSMLAYRENLLKKRLAYSTISQVSYIVFGLMILHPIAFVGAILHVVYHAIIKTCLFLSAGTIIHETGKTKVNELLGIGKQMPGVLWGFTFAALSLVGIPPAAGFVSKWNLCIGALNSDIKVFAVLGPIVLLISALLTAGYLLTITIRGFLPGEDFMAGKKVKRIHTPAVMLIPVLITGILAVVLGIFPNSLISVIEQIAAGLL